MIDESRLNQRLAADPACSVFVAANAGSGKTRVLTDRVARLLLSGVMPTKILCITYTKAAAAEMADRLFKLLGAWALADDESLAARLAELEGAARQRSPEALGQARRLFARALETPGGLKIQTIHSFCESVLKRFPIEAAAPPGFAVIDETKAAALANRAIDSTTLAAANDPTLDAALKRLSLAMQPDKVRALLSQNLYSRQKIDDARLACGGWEGLIAACRDAFGAGNADIAQIKWPLLAGIDNRLLRRALAAFDEVGGKPKSDFAPPLSDYFAATDDDSRWVALRGLFATQKRTARKLGTAAVTKFDPTIEPYLKEVQTRFLEAQEKINACENYADVAAFLLVLAHAADVYAALKAARAGLDYDDLIDKARRLLDGSDGSGAWVRYKLDQGLDHILLDEAQDTSPAQWQVIEGPLAEFFAGLGAHEGDRSFFAVGDQKQSIYSFQGADASLFHQKRIDLGKTIAAVAPFAELPLRKSFRSTAPVLNFVDLLFAADEARVGVTTDFPLRHDVERLGEAGLVELWPLVPRPEKKATRAWDAPLDSESATSAASMLTAEVCATIKGWLDDGQALASRGRRIRPGDLMILVQNRGPLFHEMIRALSLAQIPVAGADKIKLLDDAGVEDLLSYARTALLATDDLSLAETLRSPFFDIDEQSLYDLAQPRGEREPLWSALTRRAGEREEWRKAHADITLARAVGMREGAYAFFMHLLETGGTSGRRRLYRRLGEASAEPIAEFLRQALEHESAAPRSLQNFVAWAQKNAGEIKRDMEQSCDAVRVMTVHGAKGLEAEIVFLLDGHRHPPAPRPGSLFFAPCQGRQLPVLCGAKLDDGVFAAAARERTKLLAYEEYRRLLYVAATRARDRLYICGHALGTEKYPTSKSVSEMSWHALALKAFGGGPVTPCDDKTSWGAAVLRIEAPQTAALKPGLPTDYIASPPLPAWARDGAPRERGKERVSPSRLADEIEMESEAPVFSPARRAEALLRGRCLHRLLELLPDLPAQDRPGAADRLLQKLAPEIDGAALAQWRDEALRVLADPAFSPVFSEASAAEVAVAGRPRGARSEIEIMGQIDRLAIMADRVLILDYKTNRPPPARVEDTPHHYLAQLAAYRALLEEIYPGRTVEAALLWTFEARLTVIPAALLDHAFARTLA